jgi:2-polyprenyl-3-methyl-5-hydroxy-6-metoxy-1,4-benzoquinol methylase
MALADIEVRAAQSRGVSDEAILRMVCRALERRNIFGESVVDVGCGAGNLRAHLGRRFRRYVGVDAVLYEEFPEEAEFLRFDLESGRMPLPDRSADVVAAVEVIEHLENPRDFMRKLVRLAKPGGWVVVTTPNQLSLLSVLTLLFKRRFQAFQDVHYPAHITALLEVDLTRIAEECDLSEIGIEYSLNGRIPSTAFHYPLPLARRFPRALSENVLLIGRRARD